MEPRTRKIGFYIIIVLAIGVVFAFAEFLPQACEYRPSIPGLKDQDKGQYVDYLTKNRKAPAQFVSDSFASHDVVFLGQDQFYIGFTQNMEIVRALVPLLARQGVTTIALGQVLAADQADVDLVCSATEFDGTRVRQILSNRFALVGYQEYADFFKVVWKYNRDHAGEQPVRILGIGMKLNMEYITKDGDEKNPEILKKVYDNTIPEEFVFGVIDREILQKHARALIVLNLQFCLKDVSLADREADYKDMGLPYRGTPAMLVHGKIGDRSMVILMHNMWVRSDNQKLSFPMDGIFDAVMRDLPEEAQANGFIVAESPFKDLKTTSYFRNKDQGALAISYLCDGYILNKPLYLYRTPLCPADFIDKANFETVRRSLGMMFDQSKTITAQDLLNELNKNIEGVNSFMSYLTH